MAASNTSHIKRWVIGGLIAVFAVVLTASFLTTFRQADGKQSSCQVRDSDADPIPFKRLSDEKSFPFLHYGKRPLPEQGNAYIKMRESATRFLDVRSCLMESEKEKQIPNLNRFEWNKPTRDYDTNVCLFRVFSSIGSAEISAQWLENQGFDVYEIQEASADFYNLQKPGKFISASWDILKCGDRFKRTRIPLFDLNRQFLRLMKNRLDLNVIFSADGEVIGISIGFPMN